MADAESGRGGAVRKTKRKRAVRWSMKRETRFLEALAELCSVRASAKAAGIAETTLYRRRTRHPAFREAWEAALQEGYSKLEAMLLDRAVNGVERTVWYAGKKVGTVQQFSDRLALTLLARHGRSVAHSRDFPPPSDDEIAAMRERVGKRMQALHDRIAADDDEEEDAA